MSITHQSRIFPRYTHLQLIIIQHLQLQLRSPPHTPTHQYHHVCLGCCRLHGAVIRRWLRCICQHPVFPYYHGSPGFLWVLANAKLAWFIWLACYWDSSLWLSQFFFLTSTCQCATHTYTVMQAGFSLLEAGSIGASAVTSVLFKNLADVVVGAVFFWAVGYGIAYGSADKKFIGTDKFFMNNMGRCEYSAWFFQWTFAATAVTIVSGAMAGRTQLRAYLVYSIALTSFIYPIIVHWTWSGNAWLATGNDNIDGVGYVDFAGSGIVHCTGK